MQLNFNASTVAPSTQPEPVPDGIYPVRITSAEEKPTKNNQGSFLELGFTIINGQFSNRKVIGRLNLKNPNPQAVEIAYGELSAICHVTGRMQIQNAQQLLGAELQVVVSKVPRNDRPGQYGNEINGYKDMNGNDPAQGQAGGGGGQNFGGGNNGGYQGGNDQGQNFNGNNGGGQNFNQNGQGQNFGGGQQGGNNNGGNWDQNNQGGNQNFNGNNGGQGNQNGGGYQQQGNNGGGQNFNGNGNNGGQQGQNNGGQNFQGNNNGGGNNNGNGGPAGNGNMPSWA